jgi:predicted dehydrogenase
MNWATEIIPQVRSVAVVGCVARDQSRIPEIRARWPDRQVPFFGSLSEAIRETDADGVLVLTTAEAHAVLVDQALALNRHVLVEKPFVKTSKDAAALAQVAETRGLVLMVNQNFRFFPAAQRAAEIVRSGEFGRLSSIAIDFSKTIPYPDAERARRHYEMEQPLLIDLAIHHFDLMRMVIGADPISIHCLGWNRPGSPFRDPANATAIVTFDNEVVVTWRASWEGRGHQTTFSGEWTMQCEKADVFWACRGDRDVSLDGDRVCVAASPEEQHSQTLLRPQLFGRAAVLDAFAAAVETGRIGPFFPHAHDNVKSLRLMEAALRSHRTGEVVAVPRDLAPIPGIHAQQVNATGFGRT